MGTFHYERNLEYIRLPAYTESRGVGRRVAPIFSRWMFRVLRPSLTAPIPTASHPLSSKESSFAACVPDEVLRGDDHHWNRFANSGACDVYVLLDVTF